MTIFSYTPGVVVVAGIKIPFTENTFFSVMLWHPGMWSKDFFPVEFSISVIKPGIINE